MSRKRKRTKTRQSTKTRKQHLPLGSNVTLTWRLLRAVPALLLLMLLTILLSRFGTLHNLETVLLDAQLRLSPPPERSEVAIVNITEDDYQHFFGATRPLDTQRLHELIDAIASGGPKVIGVDIDTSAAQFQQFNFKDGWPPVVWEREVEELPETVDAEQKPRPMDVLGGKNPKLNESSGLALLIEEGEDKVTRRYRRYLENAENANDPLPSFTSAILRHSQRGSLVEGEPYKDRFIRYAGDREASHRIKLSAGLVLEQSKTWTKDQSPLSDKIVLLGGTYLGEDRHETPLGRMPGVDILGYVVETELQGGGASVPPKYVFYVLEILSGFSIVILFHTLSFSRALLLSVAVIPALAFACAMVAFQSLSGWAYFAPLLLGVVMYESFVEYRSHWLIRTYQGIRGDSHDKPV